MTNSNILTIDRNTLPSALVASNIIPREDDYIMITKKELQSIDDFSKTMGIFSEAVLLVGSGLFGYLINLIPTVKNITDLSFVDCILAFLTIFLIVCGISAKICRTTTINKVLKLYENPTKTNI